MDVRFLAVPEHGYPAASATYGALTQSPVSVLIDLRSSFFQNSDIKSEVKKKASYSKEGLAFFDIAYLRHCDIAYVYCWDVFGICCRFHVRLDLVEV